jgi:cytochrome c oxidase subunit 4
MTSSTTAAGIASDKSSPVHEAGQEHVLPVKAYAAIFGALVLLTGITVGVSLADLGSLAIYVALAVALVKAFLVVAYFMHLGFDARFNAFIFLSSLLFLAIFFVLTMIDLGSRGSVLEVQDNFVLRDERAAAAAARGAVKAAPPAAAPEEKGKP